MIKDIAKRTGGGWRVKSKMRDPNMAYSRYLLEIQKFIVKRKEAGDDKR